MKLGGRRVPGSIKYPKKDRGVRLSHLHDTLRRVLTPGGRASNFDASSAAGQRVREIIRSYRDWLKFRRFRSQERAGIVAGRFFPPRGSRTPLNYESRANDEVPLSFHHNQITLRSNEESGDLVTRGHNIVEVQRRNQTTSDRGDQAMTSQNDSIIWNNRSSEQMESNLSLVVNPPSSLSQHEDSVLSEDSQYTRSSQLDLALEDERRWLKYRIENLTRDECIITCVLAQVCADLMMLSSDELPGSRETIPSEEEAKQSLLYLSYGGCWELNNLRTVLDLTEFLPVGLRRLCGLGVRDRGSASRKLLEGRLEQCLDLTRRLNLQQAG